MCAPAVAAVAGIGVSVLQAGASYSAQQSDYAAKTAAWEQNVVNSETAARDEQVQIIGNQLVQQNKIGQQQHISYVTEAQKQASAASSAASSGVSGISVDNILSDIANKSEVNRSYADQNYQYIVADTKMKLKSSDDQEQSRINSMPVPQAPSPLSAFAGIAAAGVKGYSALTTGSGGSGSGMGSFGD